MVDGVQAAGILATPLCELGADIIAIGGHKRPVRPDRVRLVYCREELVNELKTSFIKAPVSEGSAAVRAHVNSQFDYVRIAHRFGRQSQFSRRTRARGAARSSCSRSGCRLSSSACATCHRRA